MKIIMQRTSPNYRQKLSTYQIMRDLTIGLLVIVAYSLFYQYISQNTTDYVIKAAMIYIVSIVTALVTEIVWALIHKTNILEQLKNSFPLVTAIIFALTLPIGTPLYVVAIGSFIAIFFGKLVYGGFGQNIFNPALVGRVVVHLAFGASLTTSLPVNGIDIATKATPATMLAGTNWMGGETFSYKLVELFLGQHAGTLGETCVLAILIVGVVLALRRVFDGRIPVAYLGTVLVLSEVFALVNGLDPITYPLTHLCIGGVVFGAVIMATDPVTSPSSPLGKILYGICLGFLTMIIRLKANYPEGVLFSILIMNMLTPLIDSLILGRTNQNLTKQWAAIGISLVVAIACVFGISQSIKTDVETAKAEALKAEEERKAKEAEEAAKAASNWKVVEKINGGYVMEVIGFNASSPMKVEVKLNGEKIQSVKVLEHPGETAGFGEDLIKSGTGGSLNANAKTFYDKVLNSSFSVKDVEGIDTSTGATKTATGIMTAVKGAIEEYKNGPVVKGNIYTYTLTSAGFNQSNPMKIKVSVDKKNKTVTKVEVVEHPGETAGFGEDLIKSGTGGSLNEKAKTFHDKVLNGKTKWDDVAGIDTSTGATMTTKGIVSAIEEAIAQTK